jgi:hypothetical protein
MATKKSAAFAEVVGLLPELYAQEVAHVAETYRQRIEAREFAGAEDRGKGAPRFMRLEHELERHPWARSTRLARAVIATSAWAASSASDVELTDARTVRLSAASCLAQDVLRLARARGWTRRKAVRS